MTEKSLFLNAFNSLLTQFLDELLTLFPKNVDLLAAKAQIDLLKHVNPSSIIEFWFQFCKPHEEKIMTGELLELLSVANLENTDFVWQFFQNMKGPILEMKPQNQKIAVEYIQKLLKLSQLYIKTE